MIHATDLEAATGDKGQGMKIAVVDTGVDSSSPYPQPGGLLLSRRLPEGQHEADDAEGDRREGLPRPGARQAEQRARSTRPSRTARMSPVSPPVTRARTPRPAPTIPPVADLSGVAPKAWIGNYRVFTIPTPLGHEADTPEIVEAFEAAVADGMNVINFSGGGPQTDPANDAMYETIHNASLAGVVPVIAAGNDRDDFGLGTAGSPGVAPDAITVAATSNSHVFAPALSIVERARRPRRDPDPRSGRHQVPRRLVDARTRPLVDVSLGRRHRRQAGRGAPVRLAGGAEHLRRNAAEGLAQGQDRARLARQLHVRLEGRPREARPARSGSSSSTTASARRTRSRSSSRFPPG